MAQKQAPFYIVMLIYQGLCGFIYMGLNQTVTGQMSKVYLFASIICYILAAASFAYMVLENDNVDADVDITIPWIDIPLPKPIWYILCVMSIGYRGWEALETNTNSTGFESIWGYLWVVGSLLAILMLLSNAVKYGKKKAAKRKYDLDVEAKAKKA